jgi:hypothetical protein
VISLARQLLNQLNGVKARAVPRMNWAPVGERHIGGGVIKEVGQGGKANASHRHGLRGWCVVFWLAMALACLILALFRETQVIFLEKVSYYFPREKQVN